MSYKGRRVLIRNCDVMCRIGRYGRVVGCDGMELTIQIEDSPGWSPSVLNVDDVEFLDDDPLDDSVEDDTCVEEEPETVTVIKDIDNVTVSMTDRPLPSSEPVVISRAYMTSCSFVGCDRLADRSILLEPKVINGHRLGPVYTMRIPICSKCLGNVSSAIMTSEESLITGITRTGTFTATQEK